MVPGLTGPAISPLTLTPPLSFSSSLFFFCLRLLVLSLFWLLNIALFLISIHNLLVALRQWRRGRKTLIERDWSIKLEVMRVFLPPTIRHLLFSSYSLPLCFIFLLQLTVLSGAHARTHVSLGCTWQDTLYTYMYLVMPAIVECPLPLCFI